MPRTTRHVVVDGSNIATEGRSLPNLAQLKEAVQAFTAERSPSQVTVVVDATFGHRIEKKESKAYEKAVAAGEIITPPAGAVGRGDAFILQVANKADAVVFSNDSFQEFHGEHPWLFDEERLVGGKPVDGIGWIFVERVPVRGPLSRRSTKAGKAVSPRSRTSKRGASSAAKSGGGRGRQAASPEAMGPPPKPSSDKPPPRKRSRGRASQAAVSTEQQEQAGSNQRASSRKQNPAELNSLEAFMRFVTTYSIGDEFSSVVERYASHGCYVRASSAQCYLPSKAMGDPPPNRARDVVAIGDTIVTKVESLDSERRGINVSLISVDAEAKQPQVDRGSRGGRGRRGKKSGGNQPVGRKRGLTSQKLTSTADGSAREANPTRSTTIVAKSPAKKSTAKKSTKKAAAKKAAPKAAAKKAVKKAPAKKAAKKTAPKKAAAKKTAKKAPAKKAAKKTAPKKAAAKKTAKKAPAKKAAKKTAPKKAAAKKTAKKAPAKKAAKKTAPKKAAAKKTAKATASARAAKAAPRKAAKKAAKKR